MFAAAEYCDVLIVYEVRGGSAYAAVEDYAACFLFDSIQLHL
jgi:hypothetical protein